MLELDVMLKFWELLFALVAAGFIVIGATYVILRERRRRQRDPFYVEAGGVLLSIGEERLLEAIARAQADAERELRALARALKADDRSVFEAARLLTEKALIEVETDPDGSSARLTLSAAGNEAALARGYIKLI